MAEETEQPPFWDTVKAWAGTAFRWFVRYPLALVAVVLVVVVGVVLVKSGVDINLGGIIKQLFGRPAADAKVIAAANTIPKKRVDEDGNEIPKGVADKKGFTQWEVKKLERSTSPLRDTSVLTIKEDDGTKREVPLPTGIKDSDVDEVVEVQPEVFVVKTNVETAVLAKDLLDSLPKPRTT